MTRRILVKGAGVAGLCAAHEFRQRGFTVEVAERASTVGAGASGLAGGMLAPFCEGEAAPPDVVRLGRGAADWWEASLPGLVTRAGTLVIAQPRDAGELNRFAARTTGHEWVDDDAIAALEPSLAGRFRRGLFFADEAHLDPRAALQGLHGKLIVSGVQFYSDALDDQPGGRFDAIVHCIGHDAIGCLPGLRGVRGEMLYLTTSEVGLSRPVRLLHPRHPIYLVPRENGRFMVGATMVESDDAGPISARSMMELLNAAYSLHPAFGEARVLEASAGVRPAYPDNVPRVTKDDRGLHINGLYRHGFLLSPALAGKAVRMLAETSLAA